METFKLSIVIPCFNEETNIDEMYNKITEQLSRYKDYEVIFVDDGSSDNTLNKIKEHSKIDQRIIYISFSRNFGHQNALKAGLDKSTGDCVISMDADMQHPPMLIHSMIDKWIEGYDIVFTVRQEDKNLPVFKRITSKYFYKLLNSFSEINIPEGAADFRLLDKKVITVLRQLNENFLFFRGLVSWIGFKQFKIEYQPNERFSGQSKYSVKKMIKFASSGITSFSTRPLKISIYAGFVIALIAFIYSLYAIYASIFTDKAIQGWTSVIVSVLFIGGIQLIMVGILGEYLGKLFIENKRRPNYIISETNQN
jgi:polyisoprenyl-phosphate glycosyltransferase